MFILSGLFLEDGENLFLDFWSPFSISFLTFSARPNYLKKSQPPYGPCPTRTPQPGRPLKPRLEPRLSPSRRRPETLAAAAARAAARVAPPPDPPPAGAPPPPAGAPPPLARRRYRPQPLAAATVTRTEVAAGFSRKTVRFYFETEMRFLC